jgi:1-acyl-sn-glycerol-3-phosphate acyltransferase
MKSVIAPVRAIVWVPVVTGYIGTIIFWKTVLRDDTRRRDKFIKTVSFYSRILLWCANTKLTVKNMPPTDQPFLLVGNHLGIIDIMLIASVRNVLFVTSVEMKNTPFLGTLAEMASCIFVERRSRAHMQNEIKNIREALEQGYNVVLYPEGTSTNGERVLPFKKAMITAAAGTGVPILPMVLNFTHVNGEKMHWKWRNHICWYGDHSFVGWLFKMASLREVRAEIEFLEPIVFHSEEERRHVAENAQRQIEEKFVPIPLGANEQSTFRLPDALVRNPQA